MSVYDYKVVPAPSRGAKAKGIKGPEARFALALEMSMNTLAAEGWEYWRAETLPSEERSGLTGTVTHWRSVLIFRRARMVAAAPTDTPLLAPPIPVPMPVEAAFADDANAPVNVPVQDTATSMQNEPEPTDLNMSGPEPVFAHEEPELDATSEPDSYREDETDPAPQSHNAEAIRSELKSIDDLMRARAARLSGD